MLTSLLKWFRYFLILVLTWHCQTPHSEKSIQVLDDEVLNIIDPESEIEILAEGFEWTEGPLWIESEQKLLFSDIPNNVVNSWSEDNGLEEYLKPSGFTGLQDRGGEAGSNGLILDENSNLVLCQHGDRRVARMSSSIGEPVAVFETIVDSFEGRRLNSPNDATYDALGNLYFTDPPYGLEGGMEDATKELDFQGVFVLPVKGECLLLTREMSRPNGIALTADQKTLIVANSDPQHAYWMRFELNDSLQVVDKSVFFNTTELVGQPGEQGLPDGLKIHNRGYVFATGPGGVWIFSPAGVPIGKIRTGRHTSNVCFGSNQKSLFITADDVIMRVPLL